MPEEDLADDLLQKVCTDTFHLLVDPRGITQGGVLRRWWRGKGLLLRQWIRLFQHLGHLKFGWLYGLAAAVLRQHSTIQLQQAQRCLTSVVEQKLVFSSWLVQFVVLIVPFLIDSPFPCSCPACPPIKCLHLHKSNRRTGGGGGGNRTASQNTLHPTEMFSVGWHL